MQYKRWTAIWGLVCVLALGVGTAGAQESDSLWEPIFNKMDLEDWDVKIQGRQVNEDPSNIFRVVDSVLVVTYEDYSGSWNFGHLFYNKPFSFYILRTEYRFVGSQYSPNPGSWALQNNGLMLHSQSAESMGRDKDFPNSMETQLLGSGNRGADDNSTLNLCTPGTHYHSDPGGNNRRTAHCTSARTNHRPDIDEWAWATILVLGDSIIQHYIGRSVTGDPEFTYYKPILDNGTPLTEGYISIQSESHPTEFRVMEVLNLVGCMDEEAGTYRDYYVRHDQDACEDVGVKDQGRHGEALSWHPAEGVLLLPESGAWEVSLTAVNGTGRKISTQGERVSLFQEGSVPSGMYVVRAKSSGYDVTQKIFIP